MADVFVREFKDLDLQDATLICSVPNTGLGSTLLTDHLLEQAGMDHAAAFDADTFPPVAMVHAGKARFPVRVHADVANKVAVLRSEIPVRAGLVRGLAEAIIQWARDNGLTRIVTLDGAWSDGAPLPEPAVHFVAHVDATAEAAVAAGLERIEQGAIGGLSARLLLEGRAQDFDVLGLYAVIHDPEEDVRAAVSFGKAVPALVPGVNVDLAALEEGLRDIEQTVRDVQGEAQRAMDRLHERPEQYI